MSGRAGADGRGGNDELSDEIADEIADVPRDWYDVVHPRRGGRLRVGPPPRPAEPHLADAVWTAQTDSGGGFDGVVDHPSADPELRRILREDEGSTAAEGIRMAINGYIFAPPPMQDRLVEATIARLGLPMTVAACVAAGSTLIVPTSGRHRRMIRRTREMEADPEVTFPVTPLFAGLRRLRRHLALAPDEVHEQTRVLVEPLRQGLYTVRLLSSYLLPDQLEWVAADVRDRPENYCGPVDLLDYSAWEPAQLSGSSSGGKDLVVTVWDGLGRACAPVLVRWLDLRMAERAARADCLDVLSRIDDDVALTGLLTRLDRPDVAPAAEAAARRFPRRAARLLRDRAGKDFLDTLSRRLRADDPEVFGAGDLERYATAVPDEVPPVLRVPPWARSQRLEVLPTAITLGEPAAPVIDWEPGERNRWTFVRPPLDADFWAEHRRMWGNDAWFFLHGPDDLVRPLLPGWAAAETSFRRNDPRTLAGRFELAALPALLRLATRWPAVGASALLPYRSVDVARLMARWLARSPGIRPVAAQWFERHGVDGAVLVLPDAFSAGRSARHIARSALARLDPQTVRGAGLLLGCAAEVDAILAVGPSEVIPPWVPRVPAWLDPDRLPPVLLAGGDRRLPPPAVANLCRMIAMSDLDDPYTGLAAVGKACDGPGLARFALALFETWTLAGRPAGGRWTMDALAHFGDDAAATMIGPKIIRWPSEGATTRAKRGVDVLAAMGSLAAIEQIGRIRRTATSTALRRHATATLDRVALDQGLLPEQLDDIAAPRVGLDGPGIAYRGVEYAIDLADGPELVLRRPDGTRTRSLPPARTDTDAAVVAEWRARRAAARVPIRDQVRRLEEEMITQRRWSAEDVATLAGHPLLGRLAGRLIWLVDGRTAVIGDRGDLVDVDGNRLPILGEVLLAHPATADLAGWRAWRDDRSIVQPFPQIDRDVHDGDPSSFSGRTVAVASLRSLIPRGWRWAASGRQARRGGLLRSIPGQGVVELTIEPGAAAGAHPAILQPAQTITDVRLQSYRHGDLGVFGDLSKVTRSELMGDLLRLE